MLKFHLKKFAIRQKDLIRQCNDSGKPVITATTKCRFCNVTHVLHVQKLVTLPTQSLMVPDAVMLSGETAAGLYPEEAVKTMRNIAVSAEAAQDYKKLLSDRTKFILKLH
ncbi:pyruvate kinase [Staphylococcus aureus]